MPAEGAAAASRARRFKAACRAVGILFLLLGLGRLAGTAVTIADPVLASSHYSCIEKCAIRTRPARYLGGEAAWEEARARGATTARIEDRLREPAILKLVVAAELVKTIPLLVIFFTMAAAMIKMGSTGLSGSVVDWLGRAALASIFWVLAQPVSQSLQWTAFSEMLLGRATTHVVIGSDILWPVMLSITAWVTVHVLREAVALRREIGEYV